MYDLTLGSNMQIMQSVRNKKKSIMEASSSDYITTLCNKSLTTNK